MQRAHRNNDALSILETGQKRGTVRNGALWSTDDGSMEWSLSMSCCATRLPIAPILAFPGSRQVPYGARSRVPDLFGGIAWPWKSMKRNSSSPSSSSSSSSPYFCCRAAAIRRAGRDSAREWVQRRKGPCPDAVKNDSGHSRKRLRNG